MNEFDSHDDGGEDEPAPLQVDVYGCKLKATPNPTEDASSRITLRGLCDDVWQSLLRICRDSFGLVADVLTSGRSLVRGIAVIPAAVASRIGRAHALADQRESKAEERSSVLAITEEGKLDSVEHLETLLNGLQAQGAAVRVERLPSGQVVVSVVRPELEGITSDVAEEAVAGFLESYGQGIDEEDRDEDLLSTPISDFQLSAATHDALIRLGIHTLGELTRLTEVEVFLKGGLGAQSIAEVRKMLETAGLAMTEVESETPIWTLGTQELLARPLSDLNFSIRVRKCMVRLGLTTIGTLIRMSADELLKAKNFGATSLAEVREKLAVHGLKLSGE